MIGPEQIVELMMDFINEMDEAEKSAMLAANAEAREHRTFIEAYADAYRSVSGPNREYRQALVDDVTKDIRFNYESAKDASKLAFQHIQNVRQKLSALQSAARTVTEEAAFSRTGPNLESEVRSGYTERYG